MVGGWVDGRGDDGRSCFVFVVVNMMRSLPCSAPPRPGGSRGETCERPAGDDRVQCAPKPRSKSDRYGVRSRRFWSPLLAICCRSRRSVVAILIVYRTSFSSAPPLTTTMTTVTTKNRTWSATTHSPCPPHSTVLGGTFTTVVRSITVQLRYLHT